MLAILSDRIQNKMNRLTTLIDKLKPIPTPERSYRTLPTMKRIAVAVGVTLLSTLVCWRVLTQFELGAGDFGWAIRAARDLLNGRDPYDYPFHSHAISYPLTAAFFGFPFVAFPEALGGALFFGISSGLLAFGLTRHGYTRLLVFLSYPYFAALVTAQWSPLLMAAALLPWLMPVVLAKPHIGLPVMANYLTRLGFWLSVALGLMSFIVMPLWPLRWLGQIGEFQRFIPLLLLPGPLLLLALVNYRDRDARFLLLAAILPQRWFYDNFILWLIPKSRRELLATGLISWAVGLWRWFVMPQAIEQVGRMSILFFYMPILAVILLRWYKVRR